MEDKTKVSMNRILLASIIYAIVAQIIHSLGAIAGMGFYTDSKYFPLWSSFMMPTAGPPPMSFILMSLFFSFIIGIIYSLVYYKSKSCLFGKSILKKGLFFGLILFLVAGIPQFLAMYLLLAVPVVLLLLWTLESLIVYLLGGMIIAKMVK